MQNETIPVGLCQCGCGQATKIATKTRPADGHVKGQPVRFVQGHNRCGPDAREAHRARWARAGVPYGLCLCGCGEATPLSSTTKATVYRIRGLPLPYLRGHPPPSPARCSEWRTVAEDRGYVTPCHIWQGASDGRSDGSGYGRVLDGGRLRPAHTVAYEREYGPMPDGLEPDHLCRVPACCNPEHLEAVTHAENVRRSPLVTKLTRAQVAAIRSSPRTLGELSATYGVSIAQLGRIKRRESWVADLD